MKGTAIQWADDTVNPTSGCDGCELWAPGRGGPCYAGNFHEARLARSLPDLYAPNFTEVRTIPGRLAKAARCMDLTGRDRPDKPWLSGLRRKIFLGDLGDVLSAAVTFEYLRDELITTATGPHGSRHDWLLLTKQPQRLAQFAAWLGSWPANIWVGTSITSRASLKRVEHLQRVPAAVRFLSLEPLVGDPALGPEHLEGIAWVIVGGESDQGQHRARPFQLDWARRLLTLAEGTTAVPFVKQLGSHPWDGGRLELADKHGGDWQEWPADLRVRRMPDAA